jgi:uncharacterized protein
MSLTDQLSSICTQCGMCCDGTLFKKVVIKDDSDETLVLNQGLSVITQEGHKKSFPQPCLHYKNLCNIYATRPHACRHYLCQPLKKFKNGDMSFEEAKKIIQAALSLRAEIRILIQNDDSLSGYTISELENLCLPKPSDVLKKKPAILIKIIALNVVLKQIREKKTSS